MPSVALRLGQNGQAVIKTEACMEKIESPLQQIEAAIEVLETHARGASIDVSTKQRCDQVGVRLCRLATPNSDSDTSPVDVDKHRQQGEDLVNATKKTVVGRIYAVVGTAVIDPDHRLTFVINNPAAVDSKQCTALREVEGDVAESKGLPTRRNGCHIVSPDYNDEDLMAIRDAVSIYSDGTILMLEEADFLADKLVDQVPPLRPNAG